MNSAVLPEPGDKNQRLALWKHTIAGGIGSATGDLFMHSIDTVKTRQQGSAGLNKSLQKYKSFSQTYYTLLKEEGLPRGLYSGFSAAIIGSIPAAMLFFGGYEGTKRIMLDCNCNDTLTYLLSGCLGDITASLIYVPSEVLKTRLQLQGVANNIHFNSGYNYLNLRDAYAKIVKLEGYKALFSGYKETLIRDLPFSGLQFAFYENFKKHNFVFKNKTFREILNGFLAGWLAGVITTPFDVLKTRRQTQIHIDSQISFVSTLSRIFKNEGLYALFRGAIPRSFWTGFQSGFMFVFYEAILRVFAQS